MERRTDLLWASTGRRAVLHGLMSAAVFVSIVPGFAASPVTVGGPFSLIEPGGAVVTDAKFRGSWMLVFFGYTSCPSLCPTTPVYCPITAGVSRSGSTVMKIGCTFAASGPSLSRAMAISLSAIDRRILGLSGSGEQIASVAQKYGAYSDRHLQGTGADYIVDHSTYIYVMDPQGKFVRGLRAGMSGDSMADMLRQVMTKDRE
ncbi:SCO family protein [Ensifer sp. MPMI2T]|nr:SCO family protein [Ensifer sp. MPMI2T]